MGGCQNQGPYMDWQFGVFAICMAMTASQGYAGCRYSSGFGGLGSGFRVQGLDFFQ